MEYEIVEIPAKVVAGITKKITSQSPPMSTWGEFYTTVISKIEGQIDTKAYGLYFDFEDQACISMVACEVTNTSQTKDIVVYTIPAGKYAKFSIRGEVHQVVPYFWSHIQEVKIERRYQCDFEVFPSSATEDVDIDIYISII